jgi:hypothetical protein
LEGEEPDPDFCEAVPKQWSARSLGELATHKAAQSKATHESAEDDRNPVHVASEEETQASHPKYLVDETGGAG